MAGSALWVSLQRYLNIEWERTYTPWTLTRKHPSPGRRGPEKSKPGMPGLLFWSFSVGNLGVPFGNRSLLLDFSGPIISIGCGVGWATSAYFSQFAVPILPRRHAREPSVDLFDLSRLRRHHLVTLPVKRVERAPIIGAGEHNAVDPQNVAAGSSPSSTTILRKPSNWQVLPSRSRSHRRAA